MGSCMSPKASLDALDHRKSFCTYLEIMIHWFYSLWPSHYTIDPFSNSSIQTEVLHHELLQVLNCSVQIRPLLSINIFHRCVSENISCLISDLTLLHTISIVLDHQVGMHDVPCGKIRPLQQKRKFQRNSPYNTF